MRTNRFLGGESLLQEHVPPDGPIFEEVFTMSEADFTVNTDKLAALDDEPTAEFFLPYLGEKYWFISENCLGKKPLQQWRMYIGNTAINVYNYDEQHKVNSQEIDSMASDFSMFQAHFPIPEAVIPRDVAIIDKFRPRLGSARSYSFIAESCRDSHSFSLAANSEALSSEAWNKNVAVETRTAVRMHELAHFALDSELSTEWRDAGFTWRPVLTPVTGKPTVKDGYRLYTPNRPSACITEYAKTAESEDVAESTVAYLGGAKKLLHPAKRRILTDHDYDLEPEPYAVERRRPAVPRLPKHLRYIATRKTIANIY